MKLREFCQNKKDRKIFFLSVLFLILSILFSTSLYLKKVKVALEQDIRQLETVKAKIHRTYEIKRYIEKFTMPQFNNKEIAIAQFFDILNSKFKEAKFEVSPEKQEGEEIVLSFSIKGDSSFNRLVDLLSFLRQEIYPSCFINSVSLKTRDNLITFEIKGELRLVK